MLRDVLSWAWQWTAKQEVSKAEGAAKGFASVLLQSDQPFPAQLRALPHFGSLRELVGLSVTRLDYAKLTLHALLEVKKLYPGLGLGSQNSVATYKNKRLTGLEVAQAFTIITNAAHLFGTFATERGVLFELGEAGGVRDPLLSAIHEDLRPIADELLQGGRLHQFHYVLACLFNSRLPDCEVRETCRTVLLEVLEDRGDRLNWVLRLARQISYNRLHALAQLDCTLQSSEYLGLLKQARLTPRIGFVNPTHEHSPALDLLNEIDAYQTRAFFTGTDVASVVVQHIDLLASWWRTNLPAADAVSLIEGLRVRPKDWPRPGSQLSLRHFVRIRVPSDRDWISETRELRDAREAWQTARFLVTPMPRREAPMLDVFVQGSLEPRTASLIAKRLSEYTRASWEGDQRDWATQVWQSNVEFAISALQELVKDELRVELLPTQTDDLDRVGFGIFSADVDSAAERLEGFRNLVADPNRVAELSGLAEMLRVHGHVEPGSHLFVSLGNVVLISARENSRVAEVDGLFAHFSDAGIQWYFYEHKRTKDAGRARSQLAALSEKLIIDLVEIWEGRVAAGGYGVLFSGASHLP